MIAVSEWRGSPVDWDGFVGDAADGTVMHRSAWSRILREAYGIKTFSLAAHEGDALRGVLPLAHVRGLVGGGSLVSMPFMDYGGACSNGHDKAAHALVEAALEISGRLGVPLVLRQVQESELELPCSKEKVTMLIDLGTSDSALWARLPSERRNRVKKGQRCGLTTSFHGPEALDDFYGVFAENMRDLGSPVHSRGFFRAVLAHLPDATRIVVVRDDGRPIGAGLMLLHGGMISMPWVSSLRRYFPRCPNQVLYWEVMRFGISEGFRTFDLGRSSWNSGTFEAKRQWGASPLQLHWHYAPADAPPPVGEETKRLAWAVQLWQRLPLPVANAIGPVVRRTIPN